jgi:uncharacterized protein YbjT (DUF2867 family)
VILVTGAGGNVGGELARLLLTLGYEVRGLSRQPQRTTAEGLTFATGDLNQPQSLTGALEGIDAVFLLAGYDDAEGTVDAIRRAGALRIVLLTSGAAAGGDLSNAVERGQILWENAVRNSDLAWTILRPSGFMSNAFRWLPQLRTGDVVRAPFAGVPIAAIDPADIAAVAAITLSEPGHDRQTYRLTGPEPLLPGEQVEILAAALDRPLRFEPQPDTEARAELEQIMSREYVDAIFRFFADGRYNDARVLPTISELTGRAARTFRQWVDDHADSFR